MQICVVAVGFLCVIVSIFAIRRNVVRERCRAHESSGSAGGEIEENRLIVHKRGERSRDSWERPAFAPGWDFALGLVGTDLA